MCPNPQFLVELVTYTGEILKMENFIFCAVQNEGKEMLIQNGLTWRTETAMKATKP